MDISQGVADPWTGGSAVPNPEGLQRFETEKPIIKEATKLNAKHGDGSVSGHLWCDPTRDIVEPILGKFGCNSSSGAGPMHAVFEGKLSGHR